MNGKKGFQKGPEWKGNANGRPIGSGHKQKLFNELVLPIKNELIEKVKEMALNGNEQMLKLLIERIIPKTTDTPVSFKLDNNNINEDSLLKASENILCQVSEGDMLPEEAKQASDLIKSHRDSLVIQNLTNQMAELHSKIEKIQK